MVRSLRLLTDSSTGSRLLMTPLVIAAAGSSTRRVKHSTLSSIIRLGLRSRLRDDERGEYMSNEWERFMLENGIERQHTIRATPQQNGVAERTNRILDKGAASLLSDSHFPA